MDINPPGAVAGRHPHSKKVDRRLHAHREGRSRTRQPAPEARSARRVNPHPPRLPTDRRCFRARGCSFFGNLGLAVIRAQTDGLYGQHTRAKDVSAPQTQPPGRLRAATAEYPARIDCGYATMLGIRAAKPILLWTPLQVPANDSPLRPHGSYIPHFSEYTHLAMYIPFHWPLSLA